MSENHYLTCFFGYWKKYWANFSNFCQQTEQMHNNGIWTKNSRKEQFLGLRWSLIHALECNPNNCSSSMFVDLIMCQWWSLITYEMISLTGLARRALLGLQTTSRQNRHLLYEWKEIISLVIVFCTLKEVLAVVFVSGLNKCTTMGSEQRISEKSNF